MQVLHSEYRELKLWSLLQVAANNPKKDSGVTGSRPSLLKKEHPRLPKMRINQRRLDKYTTPTWGLMGGGGEDRPSRGQVGPSRS